MKKTNKFPKIIILLYDCISVIYKVCATDCSGNVPGKKYHIPVDFSSLCALKVINS
jgi:hypothetical protein